MSPIAVIGCVIGGLVVMAILAAIAIPTFLDQRDKAKAQATSVSLPDQILGQPRLTDAASLKIEEQFKQVSLPGEHVTGVYGTPAGQVVVDITHTTLTAQNQRDFMAGAEHSVSQSTHLPFNNLKAGRLGGQVRCTGVDYTICAFTDPGAAGVIILLGSNSGQLDLVHQVREAVEHRS